MPKVYWFDNRRVNELMKGEVSEFRKPDINWLWFSIPVVLLIVVVLLGRLL